MKKGQGARPADSLLRNRYLFSFLLLHFSLTSLAAEKHEEPAARAKPDFYLIVDYLPAAIYDRDAVSACFRVENATSAESELTLHLAAFDNAGVLLNEKELPLKVSAGQTAPAQFEQESARVGKITFELRRNEKVLERLGLRLLRDEAWPDTRLDNGRLKIRGSGDVLIPVSEKTQFVDRSFAPVRWLLGKQQQSKDVSGRILAFVPGGWNLRSENFDAAPLGPFNAARVPPLLLAADQILSHPQIRALASAEVKDAPKYLVLLLPPEDLHFATDPRGYRIILNALLSRLSVLGLKKIVFIPPFHFGANEKHGSLLARQVTEAAAALKASSVDPGDFLNETLWRVDPERHGVYGPEPNAAGVKKIEQGILNLIP